MYHGLPRDASFWAFLFGIDEDLAKSTRRKGCPCGGRLHRADYPRKPRGGADTLRADGRFGESGRTAQYRGELRERHRFRGSRQEADAKRGSETI
jgi:hypothetical protein